MNIIQNPPDNWLKDPLINKVWLVKEREMASVIVPPYEKGQIRWAGYTTLKMYQIDIGRTDVNLS